MVWTLIEPGVAIVATSLATIRPLLRAMGIKGFQVTERSTRAHGTSGNTNPQRTNQSAKRGFGSTNGTSTDIELGDAQSGDSGRGKGGGEGGATMTMARSRTTSDPPMPPTWTPQRRFSTRQMPHVAEGQQQEVKANIPETCYDDNDRDNDDDSSSEKPLEPGFERIGIQRPERTLIAAPTPTFQRYHREDTPIPGSLAGPTWLDSPDQFSSRDSSVDLHALQPEHSQSDMRMGLDTPYRR